MSNDDDVRGSFKKFIDAALNFAYVIRVEFAKFWLPDGYSVYSEADLEDMKRETERNVIFFIFRRYLTQAALKPTSRKAQELKKEFKAQLQEYWDAKLEERERDKKDNPLKYSPQGTFAVLRVPISAKDEMAEMEKEWSIHPGMGYKDVEEKGEADE